MKVLHIANGRLYGGIERVLVTFAECAPLLRRVEFDFAVCGEGRLRRELGERGATVHALGDVRLSRPLGVWRARRRVGELLRGAGYSALVCHAPWAYALFADLARARGVASVLWQHDHASGRGVVEHRARSVRADLVICNSRWTAGSAAVLQPGVPATVLYCPVLPSQPLSPGERQEIRASLGAPPDTVVIVSAGRFEPYKGLRQLVESLGDIGDLRWTLWVAGRAQRRYEHKYVSSVIEAARSGGISNRVRFIGERTDMHAVIGAADILAQANVAPEPFGLVFAEALMAGVPVVTTNAGGAAEIVDDSCGRLVPAGDRRALSGSLRALVSDAQLRTDLGRAGPSRAAMRCAPAITLPSIEEALLAMSRTAAA